MQHHHHRHAEAGDQGEDIDAVPAAVDAVFVLDAGHVGIAGVDKIGRFVIIALLVLLNGEFHPGGIGVALLGVVDGDGKDVRPASQLRGDRFAKVGGKRGDAAQPRAIIADKSDIQRGLQHRF